MPGMRQEVPTAADAASLHSVRSGVGTNGQAGAYDVESSSPVAESNSMTETGGSDHAINEKEKKQKAIDDGEGGGEPRADVFSVNSSEEINYKTMSWKKAA